ncbi:MAG: hypothetical protein MRECE_13c041 [Mycoplasmataceae bacterium CE_OT135]|nr:MAG: hypothetical protein MRECE_13c041 [Mycoplasmataceae bacterium CE_OT135]
MKLFLVILVFTLNDRFLIWLATCLAVIGWAGCWFLTL